MASESETHEHEISLHRYEPEWHVYLQGLLQEEYFDELQAFLDEAYPSDLAVYIQKLDFEQGVLLFRRVKPRDQGEVLYELENHVRNRYIEILDDQELARLILAQPSDRAADLLADLDREDVSRVLARVPYDERIKVTELLSYPEDTAGALMTKEFVMVHENDTIKKAITSLRQFKDVDDIHMVFVVDEEGRYRGHVSLKRLILSRPQTRVKRVMKTELLAIPALTDREEVAQFFTRYDFISAPVVDNRGIMVGRITADDILEVVQDEASEDILRMGGVSGEETLRTPLLRASLQRLLWLAVNLTTAFLSVAVIRVFESTIESVAVLAALMPVVAGLGGNAAGQTMSLVIRYIALGELGTGSTRRTVFREIGLGVINGFVMGLLTAGVVYIWTSILELSLIIFLAMQFNLIVAAASGSLVPLLLRRLKLDPAIASSIFVTTCTDVLGFFAFLGLAYLILIP